MCISDKRKNSMYYKEELLSTELGMKNKQRQPIWLEQGELGMNKVKQGQDAEASLRSGAQGLRLHTMTKKIFIKGL